ncbi:site-2 protease family protein [Sporichthya brevicatena]|uniref:Site-2 protease family protein n=1 Tax=Sporichthya brevicatena TaxID=171442 RepID=A0ABP3SD65_9ACTN
MLTLFGIVLFVVLLLGSVAIHEFGHCVTAKMYGMKVSEYFVGFGPKIWSFRRGETEYGLKAIPAGGYCKIIGMTDLEEVDEADRDRAFYRYSAPKKTVVLLAGVFLHLVIGFLLFVIAFMGIGRYTPTTVVQSVSECIPAATATTSECGPQDAPSPAKAAGLLEGDEIFAVGADRVGGDWDTASRLIREAGAGPLAVTVLRDGKLVTLTADLVTRERADLDNPDRVVTVGVLGVGPSFRTQHDGPIAAADRSVGLMWDVVKASGTLVKNFPDKIGELFDALGGDERDQEGLSGVVGAARVSGEFFSLDNSSTTERLSLVLLNVGGLNIFLALFNALPLLPLDGGHVAVTAYESGKRRLFRLFGKPDPGRVDITKLLPATYAFVVVLIALTVLLLAADIVNPITVS